MSSSGQNIYHLLKAQISRLETSLSNDSFRSEHYGEELNKLVEKRNDLYTHLSRHYLPQLNEESINSSLVEARDTLKNLNEERNKYVATLRADISKLVQQKKALEASYKEDSNAFDQLSLEIDSFEEILEERQQQSSSLKEKLNQFQADSTSLFQAKKRLEELISEASDKLPAFEAEPLFMYLWGKQYGTPQYKSKWIGRQLDSWVSSMVSYREQSSHYEFLKKVPELVTLEIERQEKELSELDEEVTKEQQAIAKEIGLSQALETEAELIDSRRNSMLEINNLSAQIEEKHSLQCDAEEPQGRYYEKAISRIATLLRNTGINRLEEIAEREPGAKDDSIVGELEAIESAFLEAERNMRSYAQEQAQTQKSLKALHEIETRFTRNDFDSSRVEFKNPQNIEQQFSSLATGGTDVDRVWHSLVQQHSYRRPRSSSIFNSRNGQALSRAAAEILSEMSRGGHFGPRHGSRRRDVFGTPRSFPRPQRPKMNFPKPGGGGFSSGEGF